MEKLHDIWLAALRSPEADDVIETEEAQGQLEETATDGLRRGKLPKLDAEHVVAGPGHRHHGDDDMSGGGFNKRIWKIVLTGHNPVEFNDVSLRNPVFVTMDENRRFIDVPPRQVRSDSDGKAISVKDGGGPGGGPGRAAKLSNYDSSKTNLGIVAVGISESPLTPDGFVVKGGFMLFGTIEAKMATFVDEHGGGSYEVVEPLIPVTLDGILKGLCQSTGSIHLKDPVLTYQSTKKGSTEPGLYLSCEIQLKGQLQAADILKELFGHEILDVKVMGQISKKRDWAKAPVPVECNLRAQLLKLSVIICGIIEVTEVGVDVTATRTPGSKKVSDDAKEEDSTEDAKSKSFDDGDNEDYLHDADAKHRFDGEKNDWSDGMSKHKLTLEHFDRNIAKSSSPGKGHHSVDAEGAKYEFSSVLSGSGGIAVPGSILPLRVQWVLKKEGKSYKLTLETGAEKDAWKDVLGVRGLNLDNVKFDANFSTKQEMAALSLGIQGKLHFRSEVITVDGSYDSKGNWKIEGDFKDVDLTLLEHFYEDVNGSKLNDITSKHKLEFGKLRLKIMKDSKTGGTLTFEGEASVNGYTSAKATITMSSLGLEIYGNVENIKFDTFVIEEASINVLISPKNAAGSPYRASINGIVTIQGVKINVGLHVDAFKKDPQWTVYGEIESLKLSQLGSAIENTFLDLELMKVAVIASNREQPKKMVKKVGEEPNPGPNRFSYPVKQGLQMWAKVAKVDAVSKVTRTAPVELEVCVFYKKGSLTIDIVLPTTGAIKFSNSVYTGPITLEAVISDQPHISVGAGLFVKVHRQPKPLELDFTLKAYLSSAEGAASMIGLWEDPFGISPSVQVGNLTLAVEIHYAEFFETGIPKSITFGGELHVGNAKGKLMVKVDEDPENEVVSVDIINLDLADFIEFASKVSQMEIPRVPHRDALYLRKVYIQYALTTVTIDKKEYTQGLDMDCDVYVFGHKMIVKANINKEEGISLQGSIERFKLGPLELTGQTDKTKAKLDIKINKKMQMIFIDGAVKLFDDISLNTYVDVQLMPKPKFHFSLKLLFCEALEFDLEANLIGEIQGVKTEDLDFTLSANFKQEIINFITNQADNYFKSLHLKAAEDFAEQEKKLQADEQAAKKSLKEAKEVLAQAKIDWDHKREAVNDALKDKQKYVDEKLENLRVALKDARIAFNKVVDALKSTLESAKLYWTGAVNTAESAIQTAANVAVQELEKLRKDIADAQRSLNSAFGDVDKAIAAAQEDVENAERLVKDIGDKIKRKNDEIDNAGCFQKPGLYIDLWALEAESVGLETALKIARLALAAAKDMLDNKLFSSLKAVLDEANTQLGVGETAIRDKAKKFADALEQAKKDKEAALTKAENKLEDAKNKGPFATAFQEAQVAVTEFEDGIDRILKDSRDAVDYLLKTAEYVAYEVALIAVNGWNDFIDITLKLRSLVLYAEEFEEAFKFKAVHWLLDNGKNFLIVKEVKINGELRAMLIHDKPLKAMITATVGGVDCVLWVDLPLGQVEKFLESVWSETWKKLKETVVN